MAGSGGVHCAPGGSPARAETRLGVFAAPSASRAAKLAAWNRQHAGRSRARLELVPATERDDSAPALPQLLAAGTGGAHLVALEHTDVPALGRRRQLRTLVDLVHRDRYDLKQFMPQALQPAHGLDEHLYALPEEVEARQLYFNRQHLADAAVDFRRAGLDFERPGNTWDALRQVSLDLAAAPRGSERLPLHAGHEGAPLDLWGWQNGGSWLAADGRHCTFARPENVAALDWLVAHARELGGTSRLSTVGTFPVLPAAGGSDTAAGDEQAERHPFLVSRLSLCFESTRFVSTVARRQPDFALGYVEAPRRRTGAPLVTWCRSWGYALLRGAPDVAWTAVQFLVSAEAAFAGAAAGAGSAPLAKADNAAAGGPIAGRPLWYPPFSGQLALDKRLALAFHTGSKLLDEGHDHGLEQLRHARFRPASPAPRAIWPLLEEARRAALAGTVSASGALAAAQREAQARLDAAWKER